MPPQPLSKVRASGPVRFGTGVLSEQTDLAQKILKVINIGSLIELDWAIILSELLRSDPAVGVAMYQAISSAEARRAALLAAAKSRLTDQGDFGLFQAVVSTARHAARLRNSFAHHIWGDSDDIPDALLLAPPEEFVRLSVDAGARPRLHPGFRRSLDTKHIDRSNVYVYRRADLDEALEVAGGAITRVRALDVWLQSIDTPAPNLRVRAQLSQSPPVEQALQRLSRRSAE